MILVFLIGSRHWVRVPTVLSQRQFLATPHRLLPSGLSLSLSLMRRLWICTAELVSVGLWKSHFLKENEYKINKKQSYLCVLSHSVLDSADIYSAVVLHLKKFVPKNLVFNWIFWKLTSHSNYISYFVVIISMFIIISSLKPVYILPPVSKYENKNQSYDLGIDFILWCVACQLGRYKIHTMPSLHTDLSGAFC